MDAQIKADWVKALRSGEYKQSKHILHSRYDGGYCCLGVLCEVYKPAKDAAVAGGFYHTLATTTVAELGWTDETQGSLVVMNDRSGNTFSEIADYIEANL